MSVLTLNSGISPDLILQPLGMHRSPHQTSEGSAGQGIIPLAVCILSSSRSSSLREVGQLLMMS